MKRWKEGEGIIEIIIVPLKITCRECLRGEGVKIAGKRLRDLSEKSKNSATVKNWLGREKLQKESTRKIERERSQDAVR